jgi:quercetin 2,3-dioxygenase
MRPHRQRRLVGPWCFFDHFGLSVHYKQGMVVVPHPHIGLQPAAVYSPLSGF